MGNTQKTDPLASSTEAPQHDEPMPAAYRISRYPITNAQYDAFVRDGGYTEQWKQCWMADGWRWKGDRIGPAKHGEAFNLQNHPVLMVSWHEAYAFCGWLSAKLGLLVSLPTEAQWEKAARSTDGRRYPWGPEITPDHANWGETGIGTTSAVGIFPRGMSPYGAFDMSGNVWERCLTKWRDNYDMPAELSASSAEPRAEAHNSPQGTEARVVRGGSFFDDEGDLRCAARGYFDPFYPFDLDGFRVCAVEWQE